MAGDILHWPTPPPKGAYYYKNKSRGHFLQQEILKLGTRENIIDMLVYAGVMGARRDLSSFSAQFSHVLGHVLGAFLSFLFLTVNLRRICPILS